MQLNGRDMEISVKQSGKLNNHLDSYVGYWSDETPEEEEDDEG